MSEERDSLYDEPSLDEFIRKALLVMLNYTNLDVIEAYTSYVVWKHNYRGKLTIQRREEIEQGIINKYPQLTRRQHEFILKRADEAEGEYSQVF
ncbi:MAG TPA: hypothetical protein V6D25_25415 [Leptolyngbyaceae cyanobacterium]